MTESGSSCGTVAVEHGAGNGTHGVRSGGLMDRPDDAELMRRVKVGDHDAFSLIVDRHQDPLVNYLACLTRSRDRAEEYAQEAFVRLFQTASRYRETGQLVGYLYRIATNLLRSDERTSSRRRLLNVSFAANGDRHAEPSAQRELLSEEATKRVSAALAGLPLRYRAPLVLREIEGWSYQEIASALGCREGTVKSRVSRGKKRLRDRLRPYWNGGA